MRWYVKARAGKEMLDGIGKPAIMPHVPGSAHVAVLDVAPALFWHVGRTTVRFHTGLIGLPGEVAAG